MSGDVMSNPMTVISDLNLFRGMVVIDFRCGPRSVVKADLKFSKDAGHDETGYGTIFFSNQRLVDDVLIISIHIYLEMVHFQSKNIYHRYELLIISGRSRRPVLA